MSRKSLQSLIMPDSREYSRNHSRRYYNIAVKERKNLLKKLNKTNVEDFLILELKDGVKFNVLPFLVNGISCHYDETSLREEFYNLLKSDDDMDFLFTTKLEELKESEIEDLFNMSLMSTLLPYCSEDGFRYFILYLYSKYPVQVVRLLYKRFEYILFDCIFEYIDYKEYLPEFNFKTNICDTATFSIWVGLTWLYEKNRSYKFLFLENKKIPNIRETMLSLLPEKSIHYDFICGNITSKELSKKYLKRDKNGVSISDKEIYSHFNGERFSKVKNSITAVNNIKLGENEKVLSERFYLNLTGNERYRFFCHLLQAHNYCGHFMHYNEEMKKLKSRCDNLLDEKTKLRTDYCGVKSKLSSVTKELQTTKKQLTKLESDAKKKSNNKVNKEINKKDSKIKDLKDECNVLNKEIDLANTRELELRQENSSLKKEIKKLQAIIKANPIVKEELEIANTTEEEITFDVALNFVKENKTRIFVAGGFGTDFVSKARKYDITTLTQEVDLSRRVTSGDYDVIVICMNNIHHDLLFKCNKEFKDKTMVYTRGSNIELLITDIYKNLRDF